MMSRWESQVVIASNGRFEVAAPRCSPARRLDAAIAGALRGQEELLRHAPARSAAIPLTVSIIAHGRMSACSSTDEQGLPGYTKLRINLSSWFACHVTVESQCLSTPGTVAAAPSVAVGSASQAVHQGGHLKARRDRRLAVPLDRVAYVLCKPARPQISVVEQTAKQHHNSARCRPHAGSLSDRMRAWGLISP